MLEQLVESKNNRSKIGRSGSFLTTGILVFSLFASGILWSLFAKDLVSNGNLELSSQIMPINLDEDKPAPEPVKQIKSTQPQTAESSLPIRQDNIARIDETPSVPDKISTVPSNQKERPTGYFKIDPKGTETDGNYQGERTNRNTEGIGIISKTSNPKEDKPEIEETPPVIKKKEETPKVEPKPAKTVQVSQILNGRAESLPKPAYPAPAKLVRAAGDVNVQVTIDEQGRVISANAVSGHALLKQAAENAARGARFSPTKLNGQAVKVTGIIVYKFAMQ
jgi:protein TonB